MPFSKTSSGSMPLEPVVKATPLRHLSLTHPPRLSSPHKICCVGTDTVLSIPLEVRLKTECANKQELVSKGN